MTSRPDLDRDCGCKGLQMCPECAASEGAKDARSAISKTADALSIPIQDEAGLRGILAQEIGEEGQAVCGTLTVKQAVAAMRRLESSNRSRRIVMRTINFRVAYHTIIAEFEKHSQFVPPGTWQSVDVSKSPEMATHEIEDFYFSFPIGTEGLDYHRFQIGPNLPWADDHFERDRVSGEPLNPGYTWEQWPYAHKANEFRDGEGQFNHTYAERYWPRHAGQTKEGSYESRTASRPWRGEHDGIRYRYGDLKDVVKLLVKNPLTRNAYLPVWFPEDTGVVHGGRTPCSIGYLFRMRNNRLSIFYDIRSCDLLRHFKDDVYLTIRLLLWVLQECRKRDEQWNKVEPGDFTMHIGSFHVFVNDVPHLFAKGLKK